MDPMTHCALCYTVFMNSEEAQSCPGCGGTEEYFDEVPDHFEIARFWEVVTAAFQLTERVMLKKLADRGMKLP